MAVLVLTMGCVSTSHASDALASSVEDDLDEFADSPAGPICTDRPTKGTAACTVPEGRVQIESDLIFWSRTSAGPARTDVLLYGNPTIKYGIGPDTDVQANIAPLVDVRESVGGVTRSRTGSGDLTLRLKQRVTFATSRVQAAIVPSVKLPTAERGIGNGEWEGGIAVPVQVPLGTATVTLVPQLSLLADALEPGDRHFEFQGVASVGYPIAERATLAVELWTSQDWDPAGTVRQYSADTAIAYLVNDDFQLDLGGNFGLNRATPDVQLYAGLSKRF